MIPQPLVIAKADGGYVAFAFLTGPGGDPPRAKLGRAGDTLSGMLTWPPVGGGSSMPLPVEIHYLPASGRLTWNVTYFKSIASSFLDANTGPVEMTKVSDSTALPTPSPSASPVAGVAIASGTFSGSHTQVVDLGTHQLGGTVWVNWVLRGPSDARAIFSLRLRAANGGGYISTMGSLSYGGVESVTADHALLIGGVDPGTYRVTMVETVRRQWRAGYAAKFKVFTSLPAH